MQTLGHRHLTMEAAFPLVRPTYKPYISVSIHGPDPPPHHPAMVCYTEYEEDVASPPALLSSWVWVLREFMKAGNTVYRGSLYNPIYNT